MGFNYAILILPIRAVQALFAIIVLGVLAYGMGLSISSCSLLLTASAANAINDIGYGASSPSEINFLIFCSVWTLLVLVYLILAPAKFPQFAHKYAILGVEAVTMIFWFAGFIALAAKLGTGSCFGYGPCRASKAGIVFGAFEW